MKKFYDENKNILEIVGVAKDKEKYWKSYLEKNPNYNWVQILDEDESISKSYGIKAFPTKILLDKEGKIVYRDMGENKEFYTKVKEIISKG